MAKRTVRVATVLPAVAAERTALRALTASTLHLVFGSGSRDVHWSLFACQRSPATRPRPGSSSGLFPECEKGTHE